MGGAVWVSGAMMDDRLLRLPLATDLVEQDGARAIEALNRNDAGEPLPPDWFPRLICPSDDARRPLGQLPELFPANTFWIVSQRCADVLRRFDLGQGALHPVRVVQKDRTTPVAGHHWCLNFGNVKRCFLPAGSPRAIRNEGALTDMWFPPFAMKDGDIAVSASASTGPDIWIDPALKMAFFVSDPLASALKAAGAATPFGFRKCRLL